MSGNYWFIKVIPSCVACSAVVFGVIQYMQVTPLNTDLSKFKAQLENQKNIVKTTKEYQALQTMYLEEKIKRELLTEKLKLSARLEIDKKIIEIELESAHKKLKEYDRFSDYDKLNSKLVLVENNLSERKIELSKYKRAYEQLLKENKSLNSKASLKEDLVALNKKKGHFETILDCMSQGCRDFFYKKYDKKYEPIAFNQYKHQLDETNKQISLIYFSVTKN